MMKASHIAATYLLPGFLLLAGCRGTVGDLPEKVDVTFSLLGTDTRTTSTIGDGNIDRWTLLLYRDGKLADVGSSGSGTLIRRPLETGTYTAFAIVNPPSSFSPDSFHTLSDLSHAKFDLKDNSPSRLMMAGWRTITVSVKDNRLQTIGVDRLVAKASIQKISVNFTDPVLQSRTLRLKAIYLTNCYGKTRLGNDEDVSWMDADASCWYNRMGFHSDTGVDALLADRGIDAIISASSPYKQKHHYYCFPNQADQDSRSGNWSIRHTRLVLEAEIDGKTYYYPITLPATYRNKSYIIEEAFIRKLGSNDPEKDEPGSIDVVFSTSSEDWGPIYTAQENS